MAGNQADSQRQRHEPGRPSAWRRRRKAAERHEPCEKYVGQRNKGGENQNAEEIFQCVYSFKTKKEIILCQEV